MRSSFARLRSSQLWVGQNADVTYQKAAHDGQNRQARCLRESRQEGVIAQAKADGWTRFCVEAA